jgi:hypothetical protein
MVKKQKDSTTKKAVSKGFDEVDSRAGKINASTIFETCSEQLSAFGGLLGLIKFIDLIKLEEIFEKVYRRPTRGTKLGDYRMVVGI